MRSGGGGNLDCVHLGERQGQQADGPASLEVFRCHRWRRATTTPPNCLRCDHWRPAGARLALASAPPTPESQPAAAAHQGVVVNRHGLPAGLKDLYLGASVFGVMGGPSLKTQDLSLLDQRGIVVLSVNNCAAALPANCRPQLWVHSDPARKFHDSIWRDPGILKFTPATQWRPNRKRDNPLRFRQADGSIRINPDVFAVDMPGVLGFDRNHDFNPETFLEELSFNNGVSAKKPAAEHWPHVVNTFFVVLKLCYFLGFRRVFLLGADFYMDAATPYAMGETKNARAAEANNCRFVEMSAMCDRLQPFFLGAGYQVINCTPDSKLWSFPRMDFEAAVAEVVGGFEQQMDCKGWYYDKDS